MNMLEVLSAPGHELPKRGRSCVLCKVKKIKCDGRLPCGRCWRLGMRCILQAGGGVVDGGGCGSGCCSSGWSIGPSKGAGGSDGGGASSPAPSSAGSEEEGADEEDEHEGAAVPRAAGLPFASAPRSSSASAWSPPPALLMGMVSRRMDPRPLAQLLAQCVILKHRQGLLDRGGVLRILYVMGLRSVGWGCQGSKGSLVDPLLSTFKQTNKHTNRRHWAWKNELCGGVDASWGAVGAVMQGMGLSPLDMVGAEAWQQVSGSRGGESSRSVTVLGAWIDRFVRWIERTNGMIRMTSDLM